MRLTHTLNFELEVDLPPAEALAFVRDVPRSFAHATFLDRLRVEPGPPVELHAELPVAAAFFGQQALPFRSLAKVTPRGGLLVGQAMEVAGPGWAQVDGEAEVLPLGQQASLLRYGFRVQAVLNLPKAEGWGGRALQRMIERAGQDVLRRLEEAFPRALAEAAAAPPRPLTSPRRSG